jgi:hypothetical protein
MRAAPPKQKRIGEILSRFEASIKATSGFGSSTERVSVEHKPPAILFKHSPKAHIAAHGRTVIKRGAMPAATSQLQLRAAPITTASTINTITPFRPRSQ